MSNGEQIIACLRSDDKTWLSVLAEDYKLPLFLVLDRIVGRVEAETCMIRFTRHLLIERMQLGNIEQLVNCFGNCLDLCLSEQADRQAVQREKPEILKAVRIFLNSETIHSQAERKITIDTAIVKAFERNDTVTAFTLIVEEYFHKMCQLAEYILQKAKKYSSLNDVKLSAKDIPQSLFCKMLKKTPRNLRAGELQSYLMTATHNEAVDYLRNAQQYELVDDRIEVWEAILGPDMSMADTNIMAHELEATIDEIIAGLPEKKKQAISLYRNGITDIAKIADQMGTNYEAAQKNLRRAQIAIAKRLGIKI